MKNYKLGMIIIFLRLCNLGALILLLIKAKDLYYLILPLVACYLFVEVVASKKEEFIKKQRIGFYNFLFALSIIGNILWLLVIGINLVF